MKKVSAWSLLLAFFVSGAADGKGLSKAWLLMPHTEGVAYV
jgi:hypothetical protein